MRNKERCLTEMVEWNISAKSTAFQVNLSNYLVAVGEKQWE